MACRCSAMVHGISAYRRTCSRQGVLLHDGKRYCKQHYPPTVEKRQAEIVARVNAKCAKLIAKGEIEKEKNRMVVVFPSLVRLLRESATLALKNRQYWADMGYHENLPYLDSLHGRILTALAMAEPEKVDVADS